MPKMTGLIQNRFVYFSVTIHLANILLVLGTHRHSCLVDSKYFQPDLHTLNGVLQLGPLNLFFASFRVQKLAKRSHYWKYFLISNFKNLLVSSVNWPFRFDWFFHPCLHQFDEINLWAFFALLEPILFLLSRVNVEVLLKLHDPKIDHLS